MKVGVLTLMAVLLLALPAFAGNAVDPCIANPTDTDGDGVCDVIDNCINVANAPPQDCDTDQDGYGNICDGDFDNGGTVSAGDFSNGFLPDFQAGTDSGIGSDMDCGGTVSAGDFSNAFLPQFSQGFPGPSGWSCAGTVPCLAP